VRCEKAPTLFSANLLRLVNVLPLVVLVRRTFRAGGRRGNFFLFVVLVGDLAGLV
jgi:hypothetical protein